MTPDSESPDIPDRISRPSGRAIALGIIGVLAAGVVVVTAGFLGAPTTQPRSPEAGTTNTQSGQLTTFPFHDEKPMKQIGKGVPGITPTTPSTVIATPTATPIATPTSTTTPSAEPTP